MKKAQKDCLQAAGLLVKGELLRGRSVGVSIIEILVPLVVGAAIFIIRNKIEPEWMGETTTWRNNTLALFPTQWALRNMGKPCFNPCKNRGRTIALAPQNDYTEALRREILSYGFVVRFFDSTDDIREYVKGGEYHEELCLGFSLEQANIQSGFTYRFLLNSTSYCVHEPLVQTFQQVSIEHLERWGCSLGVAPIQNWLANVIYSDQYPGEPTIIKAQIMPVRTPDYLQDQFYELVTGSLSYFFLMPLLLPYMRMVNWIVREKQLAIQALMQVEGISKTSIYLAWLGNYFLTYLVLSLSLAGMIQKTCAPTSDYSLVWVIYFLYCANMMAQSLFISAFFNKAKPANITSAVFFLFQSVLIYIFAVGEIAFEIKVAASIVPFCAAEFFFNMLLKVSSEKKAIQSAPEQTELEKIESAKENPYIELPDNFQIEQESRNRVIKIKNLVKHFKNKPNAVNDLSMTIYNNEVLALLGRNGAGKTTTVSILTGILSPTSGSITVLGCDMQTEAHMIRHQLGYCPQADIIYPDLTVREQLWIYGILKGVPRRTLMKEVEQLLQDSGLTTKAKDKAKNLSGGQKRRLCLARGYIGAPKIIILDEPTSGLDPTARRLLWDMVKKNKSDRITILVTHFMDEAEHLGDRIAIMSGGRLLCFSSNISLKKMFCLGYKLTIAKDSAQTNSQPIIEFVMNHMPEAKLQNDTPMEVHFQLPSEKSSEFGPFFEKLESLTGELGIQSFGIAISALEDVFLKLMDENESQNVEGFQTKSEAKDEIENNDQSETKEIVNTVSDINQNKKTDDQRYKSAEQVSEWITLPWLIKKRFFGFRRDKTSLIFELILPSVMVLIGSLLGQISIVGQEPSNFHLAGYQVKTPIESYYGQAAYVDPVITAEIISFMNKNYWNVTFLPQRIMSAWDLAVYLRKTDYMIGNYYFTHIEPRVYIYNVEVQTINKIAIPLSLMEMDQAIIRKELNNPNFSFNMYIDPWPATEKQMAYLNASQSFLCGMMIGFGLSFIPSSIIQWNIRERMNGLKYQTLLSGANIGTYWVGNLIVELTKHFVPVLLLMAIVSAFQITAFQGEGLGALFTITYLYGWSIIPFTYLTSFLFTDPGNGQIFAFFFNFLSGGLLAPIVYTFLVIPETYTIGVALRIIFRMLPSFTFGFAMIQVTITKIYGYLMNKPYSTYSPFTIELAGIEMIYLACEGPFYFCILLIVEGLRTSPALSFYLRKPKSWDQKAWEDDVEREDSLLQIAARKEFRVRIRRVRKVYQVGIRRQKVAVDRISIGVKPGETLALLGSNGAGKTTMFKMLTGEEGLTSGSMLLNNYSIQYQTSQAKRQIGYCPQADALDDNLTAEDHLKFFGGLKGVHKTILKDIVAQKLIEFGLEPFKQKASGTYSGGTKRKLCMAIASIVDPPILLLDEPTTGMDPASKRKMWKVITEMKARRPDMTIVLTTHSMEESEALADRIAIQVNGQLQCIGTPQMIKTKFGNGYMVDVQMQRATQDDLDQLATDLDKELPAVIKEPDFIEITANLPILEGTSLLSNNSWIQSQIKDGMTDRTLLEILFYAYKLNEILRVVGNEFGACDCCEWVSNYARLKLTEVEGPAKIFTLLENQRNQLGIAEYNIQQTSIEQIFNEFATGQRNTVRIIQSQMIDQLQEQLELDEAINQSPPDENEEVE